MLVNTKNTFLQIRENGIGNGFTVSNPADGYRKDDRLWFGTCDTCGKSVTNSSLTGRGWEHELVTIKVFRLDGSPLHTSSKNVDYCPDTVIMPS